MRNISRRALMGVAGAAPVNALKFTLNQDSQPGTITLTIPSGLTEQECTNIQYSLNGRTWVTYENHGNGLIITSPTLVAGDSVWFRGKATKISKSTSKYSQFSVTQNVKMSADGSVMSLIGDSETLTSYGFYKLFYNCAGLTQAPELPATALVEHCYDIMFAVCTSLTQAPELPATTLASSCYYNMFSGCNHITKAPVLPATTLASNCYNGMFNSCSILNNITMLATNISALNCLTGWVSGVSATGTFIKDSAMTSLPTGVNGIPSGWTVQDYVP